jgi:hypothetical protein
VTRVLPIQLQIGDRFNDEEGEWGDRRPARGARAMAETEMEEAEEMS